MKKLIAGLAAGAALLAFTMPVLAANPKDPADFHGLDHPGNTSQLYLYEKEQFDCDVSPCYTIKEDGAWGKMSFNEDSFSFNGHGLEPNTNYTLLRYKDPWPGSPVCLASGVSNNGGNLNLSEDMQDGGPKVWLVLSSDVNCGTPALTGWHPAEYLFEYNTI